MNKKPRLIARFSLAWLIVAASGFGGCRERGSVPPPKYSSLNPSADFELVDQDGQAFHLKNQRGKIILLFFGYLSCPDVCPTMLSKLTKVYKLLGSRQQDVLTVFVTIDPDRDTPPKLKEYLSYFRIKSLGLTGSRAQVDRVVEAYGASYERVPTQGGQYLMNHSDYLYLINKKGQVSGLFQPQETASKIAEEVKNIL